MEFNSAHRCDRLFIIFLCLYSSLSLAQYENSDPSVGLKSLSDVIKWRLNAPASPERIAIELSDEWKKKDFSENNYAVWVGHATFVIKNNDITVLTDPIFSNRASPVGFLGPKRLIPPAISIKDLPKIDVIVISHNHYDHLDIKSIKKIQRLNPSVEVFVPLGDKKLLERKGISEVSELGWWDSVKVKNTEIVFTPAQHWSGRGLFDRNKSWWGGWLIRTQEMSIFHAGDTGYSKDFKEIHARYGDIDVAFIPIGAYKPRWFMGNQHVDPKEALKIASDLNVKKAYGMHWGTFILTDEPILEPMQELERIKGLINLNSNLILTAKPGEWLTLNE